MNRIVSCLIIALLTAGLNHLTAQSRVAVKIAVLIRRFPDLTSTWRVITVLISDCLTGRWIR
jgi:hypothetical protein